MNFASSTATVLEAIQSVTTQSILFSERKVTKLENVKQSGQYTELTLVTALDEIKSDQYKNVVDTLRLIYTRSIDPNLTEAERKEAKELYDDGKRQQPAYAFNGTFQSKVDNAGFTNPSGAVIIDIDHLADSSLIAEEVKHKLAKNSSIVAAWISPSGDGVKALVACPLVQNNPEYKVLFAKLVNYFWAEHELIVDASGSDVRRLCFASHDPEIYTNYNAAVIDLSSFKLPLVDEKQSLSSVLDESGEPSSQVNIIRVQAALKFIKDYSYDSWFKVAAALTQDFGDKGFDLFHAWSKRDGGGYQGEKDCLKQYNAAKRTEGNVVTCESIFYQATRNGWDCSIDLDTALEHIEDTDNRAMIVNQVAKLTLIGLRMSDIHELAGAIVAKGKLGHVKTTLVNEIIAEAGRLFELREAPDVTEIYPLKATLPKAIFPDCNLQRNGVKVKPTSNNLAVLLKAYGITCEYDVISKEQTIKIPGVGGSKTLDANANFLYVQSLLALNDIDKSTAEYLPIIFRDNAINPVLDWIAAKPWDEADRLSLFYETVSVHPEYEAIKTQVLRLWLLQTIAAGDNGEQSPRKDKFRKFEYVLTLQGAQGVHKTTWIRKLLPMSLSPYIKTSVLLDIKNKDSVKAAVSCWICELGELDATFKRSDIAGFKAFSSNEVDEIRLPYDRLPNKYERRTSLIASVNEGDFLHDMTGSRRFWTLGVTGLNAQHAMDMQQLWAQVFHLYLEGAMWWPEPELDHLMASINEYHTERSPVVDLLELTFDLNNSTEGERYSMAGVKNQMSKKQVFGSATLIDLSNQAVSRQIGSYLSAKGIRATTAREWNLVLKVADTAESIAGLTLRIIKDTQQLQNLEAKKKLAEAA